MAEERPQPPPLRAERSEIRLQIVQPVALMLKLGVKSIEDETAGFAAAAATAGGAATTEDGTAEPNAKRQRPVAPPPPWMNWGTLGNRKLEVRASGLGT